MDIDELKDDPGEAPASHFTAGSSSSISQSAPLKKPRRLLNNEGKQILQEFYNNVAKKPTLIQRKEILARVNALPGNEWYTLAHVSGWFKARWVGDPAVAASSSPTQSFFSSTPQPLSNTAISNLKDLLEEQPNPSDKQIHLWAKILKVKAEDCIAWIRSHRSQSIETTVSKEGLHDTGQPLPTPAPTVSPEPKTEPFPPILSLGAEENTDIKPQLSSPLYPPPPLPPSQDWFKGLVHAVSDSCANPRAITPVHSLQEFVERFEPHEVAMQSFLAKVERGEYAAWGFKPVPKHV